MGFSCGLFSLYRVRDLLLDSVVFTNFGTHFYSSTGSASSLLSSFFGFSPDGITSFFSFGRGIGDFQADLGSTFLPPLSYRI